MVNADWFTSTSGAASALALLSIALEPAPKVAVTVPFARVPFLAIGNATIVFCVPFVRK